MQSCMCSAVYIIVRDWIWNERFFESCGHYTRTRENITTIYCTLVYYILVSDLYFDVTSLGTVTSVKYYAYTVIIIINEIVKYTSFSGFNARTRIRLKFLTSSYFKAYIIIIIIYSPHVVWYFTRTRRRNYNVSVYHTIQYIIILYKYYTYWSLTRWRKIRTIIILYCTH